VQFSCFKYLSPASSSFLVLAGASHMTVWQTGRFIDSILDCHMQIPLLHGSYKLEKMAFRMSWIAGRSGKHLFLKDIEDEKPPLLLQMVTDYGDLHFMYAIYMLFYMNCHKIRSHCLTKTGACNIHYLSISYTSFRMQISSPVFRAPCCLLKCLW
jgi:hypothetical protein